MNPRIRNGWLLVDTDSTDEARVEIALAGARTSKAFAPAFRDYDEGRRVAMVRMPPATGRLAVYVRVDGVETMAGMLTL